MKIFVSSVAAMRTESSENGVVCLSHRAVICLADSEEYAERSAMIKAVDAYPESEGWYGHSVRPEAIDEKLLDDYMAWTAENLMASTKLTN